MDRDTVKKCILPMVTAVGISAVGISAVGAAGINCALLCLSCFMDGDPSRYPVAFPASLLAGLLCLTLFVLLIGCYVRLRKKAPSVLWTLADAALALALAWPFFRIWLQAAATF